MWYYFVTCDKLTGNRPTTRIVSCKSNLQLAYSYCVHHKKCHRILNILTTLKQITAANSKKMTFCDILVKNNYWVVLSRVEVVLPQNSRFRVGKQKVSFFHEETERLASYHCEVRRRCCSIVNTTTFSPVILFLFTSHLLQQLPVKPSLFLFLSYTLLHTSFTFSSLSFLKITETKTPAELYVILACGKRKYRDILSLCLCHSPGGTHI